MMEADVERVYREDYGRILSALIREALRALIEREASRRLARLGGSEPDLAAIPRRRTKRG